MKAQALVALLECRPMLRRKDVCRHLGITAMTLHRWLANPKIKFPRPTYVHGPLWSPSEIESFLARRKKAVAAKALPDRQTPAA